MAAEGRRAGAQVDRDVEDRAAHHTHQLALRVRRQLEVDAPDRAGVLGVAVVFLHEARLRDVRAKFIVAVGLGQEAARVAKFPGHDDDRSGNLKLPDFHMRKEAR